MEVIDMLLRLGAGILVGLVVGLEREHAQRPAGMRTHLLVALGAAAVTVAGEWMSLKYPGSDPMRLAAQVVSGIGFLGAGTIIKAGVNIRGLTTAASLWVTACLAIAAGIGMYVVAAAGTLAVLIALVVLERVEKRINAQHHISSALLEVVSGDAGAVEAISAAIAKHGIEPSDVLVEVAGDEIKIEVRMTARTRAALAALLADVAAMGGVRRAHMTHSEG